MVRHERAGFLSMVDMWTAVEVQVKPGPTNFLAIPFRWDMETEILAGSLDDLVAEATSHCTVELEDTLGAVVSLDAADGFLCGIEIVVWPKSDIVADIRAPDATWHAGLFLPVAIDTDLPIVEVDTSLGCELAPDESVIHLTIGEAEVTQSVAVARNFLIDLDSNHMLAGAWLLHVPPFALKEA